MTEVRVPELGDFSDVPIIELLVDVGDRVEADDPLLTLESDKATMDVPSPHAGTVVELLVAVGDAVNSGSPIARLDTVAIEDGDTTDATNDSDDQARRPATMGAEVAPAAAEARAGRRLVVIGGGPGGYTAAFRAADLGLEVTLVERDDHLGGVCLNVGCIPSKALLHASRVITEAQDGAEFGIAFDAPRIDLDRLRAWKDGVVGGLTDGLAALATRRSISVVTGEATFSSVTGLNVDGQEITFDQCIIATGSRPIALPDLPDDPRIVDSTGALALADIPERLLVVGGGIVGLEMACVYDALGSAVTVVELTDQLIPGCDPDLVAPLMRRVAPRYAAIHLSTRLTGLASADDGLIARVETRDGETESTFDRVLIAVGRRPNGDLIGADAAGVAVDERGFIPVDEQLRTNVPHIFAIGDIVGHPMLAHKASHQGAVAAEVAAGQNVAFDARAIPSVAYTDPEVAWTGLTESDAGDTPYEVAHFPWAASGRAASLGRTAGTTKLLVDPDTRRILGGGMTGPGAGELVGALCLAIEMGADATDLALTVQPHPTLSESLGIAAQIAEGVATDLYLPRRPA